jgi:hypothetical protein
MKQTYARLMTLALMLMVTMPALAIESETAAEAPQGLAWLLLLMGLGGVTLIGFVMFARESNENAQEGE